MTYYAHRLTGSPRSVCVWCDDDDSDVQVTLLPDGALDSGGALDWSAITDDNGAALATWIASGDDEGFMWGSPDSYDRPDGPTEAQLAEWERKADQQALEEEEAYWEAKHAEYIRREQELAAMSPIDRAMGRWQDSMFWSENTIERDGKRLIIGDRPMTLYGRKNIFRHNAHKVAVLLNEDVFGPEGYTLTLGPAVQTEDGEAHPFDIRQN